MNALHKGTIITNQKLSDDMFIIKATHENSALAGQFYMLRAWDDYPLLSRPISVYDSDGDTVSFLCKNIGKGTEILSQLKPGNMLSMLGPLGSAFPEINGKAALVGGGVGIAPLYLLAKQNSLAKQKQHPSNPAPDSSADLPDIFLGFSDNAVLTEVFRPMANRLIVNIGGFITDEINPADYDQVFTCGPDIMMRTLYDKCAKAGNTAFMWVSLERRMACGIGACLACSCKTIGGNRKVCKDGPVFPAELCYEVPISHPM